ncbi:MULTISPECIES: hypothetical protein [Burkholderia]|uniref:hypothetical protein n=1 Tax=Burkholderia TaxID=32008 RepID=UPI0007575F58|nr:MULTISPECIES: hypothetical protein [Burkholderia]AOJ72265.1 hypothetical protein WS78_26420 [Burkholderia savannae]KVG44246.1 hypothetical protein WS77_09960 [Burkholderia sp. MSMB0265]KVG87774.1 hypothetical protein WS81_25945 [Burkholderia sp. MSMB2040]KVG96383.1 hypothetical protein WS83_03210 [Burkholderia sp. MSMB2042]KVG97175.1 hypothetical protein WS82_30170 [Burkholderia sp. MSMB2041]
MNRPYEKSKDKYIAAAQTVGLLAALPFVAVYRVGAGCVRATGEVMEDVRRCFAGGVVHTVREVHSEMMDHASGKRARRERLRNQTQ